MRFDYDLDDPFYDCLKMDKEIDGYILSLHKVKGPHACWDECISKAPKCGGYT